MVSLTLDATAPESFQSRMSQERERETIISQTHNNDGDNNNVNNYNNMNVNDIIYSVHSDGFSVEESVSLLNISREANNYDENKFDNNSNSINSVTNANANSNNELRISDWEGTGINISII